MSDRMIFVVMPWHSMHYPSLGVGVLTAIAREARPQMHTETVYANLMWADFLYAASEGKLGPSEYRELGEDLFFKATGEWVFAAALHDAPEWNVEEYRAYFGPSPSFEWALQAHRVAGAFIDQLCDHVLAKAPDIVALTTVFQQNVPCLALAKRLKQRAPHIKIIMGGGNCDGEQGDALHRNFDFLDFIVRGEGERPFREFLQWMDGERELSQVASLCWRREDGSSVVNPAGPLTQAADFPTPIYDDYFEQALSADLARDVEPNIILESSRGCWWGQKHHCTFCGLNGTGMEYRSKDPDVFVAELEHMVDRHKTLDVILSDNILDMKYLNTVLPKVAENEWDIRLHYEIKSNIRREQLEIMRDAGVWHIQPGIESFSTSALRLMKKGATGAQNVKLLRECEELNLTTSWNILMGFPGESQAEYEAIQAQMPAMVHLQPPSSATRIGIVRFSPYFNDPSLGFASAKPASCYALIYSLPEEELRDLVYVFEAEQKGVDDAAIAVTQKAVEAWNDAYGAGSTLISRTAPEGLVISDRRHGWEQRDIVLDDPLDIALYQALDRPHSIPALTSALEAELGARDCDTLAERLQWFKRQGLVFEEDDTFIALATKPIPFRLRLAA